jgi:hypothetical protein
VLEIALTLHRFLNVGWRRAVQLEFMTASQAKLSDSSPALQKQGWQDYSARIDRSPVLVK